MDTQKRKVGSSDLLYNNDPLTHKNNRRGKEFLKGSQYDAKYILFGRVAI